jgi:hypothetical protein
VNILFAIMGIGNAVAALMYANRGDLGNALIFAGFALAVSTLPYSTMPRAFYKLPLSELADEMVRRPGPRWLRAAVGISWILLFAGLVVAIIGN